MITKAKKSIAAFKLREGMAIGTMVTLRGDRMYEFLDRLLNVALPRVRDFRGVSSKSFDGRGNYTLGVKDQLIFPEIDYSKVEKTKGMNISHYHHCADGCRRCGAAEADGNAVPGAVTAAVAAGGREFNGNNRQNRKIPQASGREQACARAEEEAEVRSAGTAIAAGAAAVPGRSCASTESAGCASGNWR